jgi:hypothetical protein
MHQGCQIQVIAGAVSSASAASAPKRQRKPRVKGYVAPTTPGTINTAAGSQGPARTIRSEAHAWSVTGPDGTTAWYSSREEAAAAAANTGDNSYLRPQAAPTYARYRFGKERSADARSHELAAGLARSLEGFEPGGAIDAGWLLEMIADGVGQCGFVGPVTVTFSRALFENTYEELARSSYFDGLIPNPTGLPDRITEFGTAFGMTIAVAALAPTSSVSCVDPASSELFVTVLPTIAGVR